MATTTSTQPWQTSRYHSGLVPIADGARQIFATVAGKQRISSQGRLQPLVIIEPGLGGVAAEHVVVAQLVAIFARVLRYDRAGYGQSTFDKQPDAISATDRGHDLSLLLEAINLPPPYILVGQSYGGTLVREFLDQRGDKDIEGMVLVDCMPLLQLMESVERLIPILCGDKEYGEVIGLQQNLILTADQYQDHDKACKVAEENGTIAAEQKVAFKSQDAINQAEGIESRTDEEGLIRDVKFTKQPLGNGRMSVLVGDIPRDFQTLLDHAKAHGNGNEKDMEEAAYLVAACEKTCYQVQSAQAALTAGESRVIKAPGTGRTHNLHMTRPDLVANEVKWVMEGVWKFDDE